MVHYDELETAKAPPQICPKCGSHRTEIVGRSNDGEMIVLRCNACGERSRVTIGHDAAAAATRDAIDVATEKEKGVSTH